MSNCPRCGRGEIIGRYKQFYERDINGRGNGDVDVRVEWKCDECKDV
ncbi:hypothetical protein ES707_17472 [subsurface metagenome]